MVSHFIGIFRQPVTHKHFIRNDIHINSKSVLLALVSNRIFQLMKFKFAREQKTKAAASCAAKKCLNDLKLALK